MSFRTKLFTAIAAFKISNFVVKNLNVLQQINFLTTLFTAFAEFKIPDFLVNNFYMLLKV